MHLAYYFRKTLLSTADGAVRHERARALLARLQAECRTTEFLVEDADVAFATKAVQRKLFDRLRGFATRHKVALAQLFGSRKHGFCYLPSEFLLVSEGDALREVLPCQMGQKEVSVLEYLEALARGRPWTTSSARGTEGRKHAAIVARIVHNPGILEPGLRLRGQNVQVSRDFGELGFVDLLFEDGAGRPLLVEIKVEPPELDKAIGQILRHQYLFAHQNSIPKDSVRVGIACPFIRWPWSAICEEHGISCFSILKAGETD